jgi:hypothetical protein
MEASSRWAIEQGGQVAVGYRMYLYLAWPSRVHTPQRLLERGRLQPTPTRRRLKQNTQAVLRPILKYCIPAISAGHDLSVIAQAGVCRRHRGRVSLKTKLAEHEPRAHRPRETVLLMAPTHEPSGCLFETLKSPFVACTIRAWKVRTRLESSTCTRGEEGAGNTSPGWFCPLYLLPETDV